MQHNWMMFVMLVILGNVISFSACNVEKLDDDLNPDLILQNRAEGQCRLVISGNVVSTSTLGGLEDVMINSELLSETVTTDEDRRFSVELKFDAENIPMLTEVEVKVEGFISEKFTVDLDQVLDGDCPFLTQVEWKIGLTPLQGKISVLPDQPAETTFTDVLAVVNYEFGDNGLLIPVDTSFSRNEYQIIIPVGAFDGANLISVTPNHNFSNGFGIVNENDDDDDDGLTLERFHFTNDSGADLLRPITIIFAPRLRARTGSIVNLSNGALIIGFDTATSTFTLLVTSLTSDLEVIDDSYNNILQFTTTTVSAPGDEDEILLNCLCADHSMFGYNDDGTSFERLTIEFQDDFSQDILIQALQRDLLHNGGLGNQEGVFTEVNEQLLIDKCEVVNLSTDQKVTFYTGTFAGVSYSYIVSGELEITLTSSICPTTSPCHQGCPE